ncbi:MULTISPECIES: DUF58 domain-containing protein [Metabacillus]|uniref:DUF58 domain-containing protein n=2 Tax=Metabacillus TaxID=2675233 RepID=A0A179SP73_9BACI|nr:MULTISPECIES: DUF58 domain-containing protein [Metabacillus]OAS82132.1 hypothetical protein A6K24_13825 [Metabacillus litoralis]QNF29797.1 DUF58 domain-containing protein [Metabacillus sp. KUDC1714]
MSIAWFIFITCLISVIQSFIFNKWGLVRLQYKRFFNKDTVFAGEEIEMIDEISNNKLLPIPWLRLESKIDQNLKFLGKQDQSTEELREEFHRTLFSLLPYQKITRRHKVCCMKRGYYELKTISLTLGDVLGFSESFDNFNAKATVTVYPEIIPIEDIPLPSHSWLGDIMVRRWIIDDPFVIAGVREYSYGDSMNSVNWKATARTGSLQVSKRDYTADHHLMIYLNFDETEDIWMPIQNTTLIEKGISYAASIAQHSISKGINTGFGCNSYFVEPFGQALENNVKESVRIEPKNGKYQLTQLYDTMAKLSMDRSMSFNRFLMEDMINRKNADILIITSLLTANIQDNIRMLETQGNKIEILMLTDQPNDNKDRQGEGEYYA